WEGVMPHREKAEADRLLAHGLSLIVLSPLGGSGSFRLGAVRQVLEGAEAMRIRLALFVLLLIGVGWIPAQAAPPSNPLPPNGPDPALPIPLNSTKPQTGPSFLVGSWNGIGWRFADGSTAELGRGMRGIPSAVLRRSL